MSKRRIKLTESDLHDMIKESVNKILKEDIYDIYDINRPKKGNKENFSRRFRDIRETISELNDSLNVIRKFLSDAFFFTKRTYNPRISEDYIRGLKNTVNELEKAFSEDSPLMTSITNQEFNTWKKSPYNSRKKTYSPFNGDKNINEKGQVTLYNPITKRVEGFTNQKAINVMKQMFNEPDDDRRSWYVEGNMLVHDHGGVSVKKDELDDGSIYRPIDALALLVRDEKGEPEDWYERNEHGDFDTY